ncbi:Uma2 family endonuclease [Candidatus Synechococcus calcipolaris G9]|uniref:Uma2 family endonuclease n=1 Tax=Candidatus Synechococcus calcipolaris G9 TaxID=1497997 RepID=A0ABT6EXD4_9SYNE|nr:Uma2 family endonuclease [Candidatus Synechococcus calcipolaris]MDG2989570.1 Uma2 family endonuclease [Candidatus Synechococcus calcipolaris G9]
MIASPQPTLSPTDYLQLESQSQTKHEYINGDTYAMAGASDAHITIAGNLFALLRSHLRGRGCRVYIADMKVRVEACNCFYYPDVMVTCHPQDQETPHYKGFPSLIVEVLSDSTEAFDRGDKFAHYQTLDSLDEYVLINTRQQRVECFRRNPEGLWVLQFYTPEANDFELRSVNFSDTLWALYEDVLLEPPTQRRIP